MDFSDTGLPHLNGSVTASVSMKTVPKGLVSSTSAVIPITESKTTNIVNKIIL